MRFKPKGQKMRNVAGLAIAVIVVLVAAWGGLWWYTEERLHDMLAATAKLQSTSDGSSEVSFDSISRGANPLRAAATMHNVRLSLLPPGQNAPSIIVAAQISVWIDALSPAVMHIGIPNRIDVSTPRAAVSITFGSIDSTAGLNPRALWDHKIYALTSQTVVIQNMDILAGGANFSVLHVDAITGHEHFNPSAGADQTALSAVDTIDGVSLPPALVMLGRVPFSGKLAHIGFNLTLSGPADWSGLMQQLHAPQLSAEDRRKLVVRAMHSWASNGGNGKASFVLMLGPSTLNAAGTAVFDSNAQPSGTLDITTDHLDAVTAALTNAYPFLQQGTLNAEAQLSPYLTTTDAGGQVLNLHVAYGTPGIVVNGTRKAEMPPWNWAAMENSLTSPAPVVTAPGDGSGAATTSPAP